MADMIIFPSLSADARYVAFTAAVSDGYSFDSAAPVVYDSCRGAAGGCTPAHSLVEAYSETGQPVPYAYTSRQSLSADGRYLAFAGIVEPNIFAGGGTEGFSVWVHDSCRGADPSCVPSSVRVSIDSNGQQTKGYSYATFAMSASARYVAFAPYDGGVLLRDTCIGAPVGCIPATTSVLAGNFALPIAFDPSISADGRRVAYVVWRFDPFTQTATSNVFVRDTCIGATGCSPRTFLVSAGPSGFLANGNSRAPMISGDGKYVVFQSDATDLVSGDTNGVTDIFRVALP
jgi:Tol biopolymer transport system component